MVVLAGSILATMQVLGVTLIAAALVIPAAVARMLTELVRPDAAAGDGHRRGLRLRRA